MNENYIFFWGYKGGNKKVLSNFYHSHSNLYIDKSNRANNKKIKKDVK